MGFKMGFKMGIEGHSSMFALSAYVSKNGSIEMVDAIMFSRRRLTWRAAYSIFNREAVLALGISPSHVPLAMDL